MELKQTYISQAICHRFSNDPTKALINSQEIDLSEIDTEVLRDFFVKPFSKIKREFGFTHPVDMSYNIIYQTSLSILNGSNFVEASQSIFKHLSAVSDKPAIKDGDVFVCKLEDIECDGSFYEGICIFKIESKNQFIETSIDSNGHLDMSMKMGFSTNKIDKAALIIFTNRQPTVIIIDKSKDAKFWKDEFLGIVQKQNSSSQTEDAIRLLENFIKDELILNNSITKEKQIQSLNKGIEIMKSQDAINLSEIGHHIFDDSAIMEQFDAYKIAFEKRENIKFQESFTVDKSNITPSKSIRRIRLDDTAEIHLLKTGPFIERGFEASSNRYFYKLFFSKEK